MSRHTYRTDTSPLVRFLAERTGDVANKRGVNAQAVIDAIYKLGDIAMHIQHARNLVQKGMIDRGYEDRPWSSLLFAIDDLITECDKARIYPSWDITGLSVLWELHFGEDSDAPTVQVRKRLAVQLSEILLPVGVPKDWLLPKLGNWLVLTDDAREELASLVKD